MILHATDDHVLQLKLQALVFDIISNKKFDMIIMLFIALNMIVMSLESFHQTELVTMILDRLNLFFIVLFTAECLMKLFALRLHYFREPWNVFDFVVVILSCAGQSFTLLPNFYHNLFLLLHPNYD